MPKLKAYRVVSSAEERAIMRTFGEEFTRQVPYRWQVCVGCGAKFTRPRADLVAAAVFPNRCLECHQTTPVPTIESQGRFTVTTGGQA